MWAALYTMMSTGCGLGMMGECGDSLTQPEVCCGGLMKESEVVCGVLQYEWATSGLNFEKDQN
jgi:hypothetical protein